ncbi:MAG: succinate dehydrogenase/fumarate reductase iron-sulfur subunit, partial [Gaiellaceae bacterium]
MQVRLRVQRSDPATGETRLQLFELEKVRPAATLLDCLEEIKDEQDGTLAFRRSCREGICGSCAVRIDGRTALACRTPVSDLLAGGRIPVLAPIGNLPLVRDLVVEMEPMWQKMRSLEPFLRPTYGSPEDAPDDGRETVVASALLEVVHKEALCINCGACVSECDALTVSPEFLGPHALAKAWRLVGDPREPVTKPRLKALSGEHGIWECTRCYLCNERCPKGVDPRDAIAKLGAEAFAAGVTRDRGARHARWFITSARTTGWLRESELVVKTLGIAVSLTRIPLALRLVRRGKAPLPLPRHKAQGLEPPRALRRIVAGQARRGA